MKGTIITCRHETLELPVLLAWKVVHTGTVPCDSYTVTFLYDKSMAEPLHLAAGFLATEGGAVSPIRRRASATCASWTNLPCPWERRG